MTSIVSSLPDRLITGDVLKAIHEADAVRGTVIDQALSRSPDPDDSDFLVLAFGLGLAGGSVAAIAWDPRISKYILVEKADDPDEDDAADRAEFALRDWIDEEFGGRDEYEHRTLVGSLDQFDQLEGGQE